jgi:DNA polymerase eta
MQYNPYGDLTSVLPTDNRKMISNGSLIAVSYEARAAGVKRSMRGQEASKACPGLVLVQVPVAYGKADIGIYRDAGDKVVQILSKRYK